MQKYLGLIAVGIVLVAFLACAGVFVVFWHFSQQPTSQTNPVATTAAPPIPSVKAAAPKLWGRDQFESAVSGKTKEQVIATVGRPDETKELPGGSLRDGETGVRITFKFEWWEFRGRVQNEVTGKPYPWVRIRFSHDGKVDVVELP